MATEGITAVFARSQDRFASLDAAALAANYAEDCVVKSPTARVHVGGSAVERAFRTISTPHR